MIHSIRLLVTGLVSVAAASGAIAAQQNQVVGTWRPISATVENNGQVSHPYGPTPQGKLTFTPDMHFNEFLYDPAIPKVASDQRGGGTDEENRAIMAGILALYGRYTIDESGRFTGNRVEGSSFPNWIGNVRTNEVLTMEVDGNRMVENFQRPGGARVTITWERYP